MSINVDYPPFTKTLSFKLLILNVAIALVGLVPGLGFIALMFLVPTYIAYLMPPLLSLTILYEVVSKRIPVKYLLIPFLFYGSFYLLHLMQIQEVSAAEYAIKRQNPKVIMKYDPTVHDIVLHSEDEAKALVGKYKVPLVYVVENGKTFSYRLLSVKKCQEMDAIKILSNNSGGSPRCEWIAYWNRPDLFGVNVEKAGLLIQEEKPSREVIDVSIALSHEKLLKKTYVFSYHAKEIGKFVTASYTKLPKVPFGAYLCALGPPEYVGCKMLFAGRAQEQGRLDTYVDGTGLQPLNHPVGVMLEIERYPAAMLLNFEDFPENAVIAEKIIENKKNEKK